MTRENIFVRIPCCLVLCIVSGISVLAQSAAPPESSPVATPETPAPVAEATPSETSKPESEDSEAKPDDGEDREGEEGGEDASPKRGRLRRPRNAPPIRARLPKGIFGADEEKAPDGKDTLLGGTVPALWELERSTPTLDDENLPSILERDTVAPPVPGKVIRHATRLMRQYDANADGVLQEDEWKKMPGAPQAIDLDGDRIITLEELVRFLGLYGRNRTIHRPHPVERYDQPRTVSSDFQWFKPVSPPPAPVVKPTQPAEGASPDAASGEKPAHDPTTDLSEETLDAEDAVVDDATYEEIVAGRQVPAERKYHTAPETLRGVPIWFLIRDRDGDGQVSLLEFAPSLSPAALALFGRLDKNGDGFITPDEVRTSTAQTPKP